MDYTILLPDHILIDIFDCLTPKTIKRCSLVCQRWNEVISNSIWIMEDFWLSIDRRESYKAKETTRKHQMIVIKNEIGDSLDVICQRNLRDLELKDIEGVVDSWKFMNLLKKLPQLETLTARINLTDLDIPDDMKVQLDLDFLSCNVGLTRLLNVKSLFTLQVSFDVDFSSYDFINFLKQQKNLKEFSINGPFDQKLFQCPELLNIDCRLTSFRFVTDLPFVHHYEFIKFLQIHQDTLKSLWMHWAGGSYDIVKEYVLKRMKNLEYLFVSFIDWILFDGDGSRIEDYLAISLLAEPFRKLFRYFFPTPPIEISTNIENIYCVLPNNHLSNMQLLGNFKKIKRFGFDSGVLNEELLKDTLEHVSQVMKDLEKLEVREIASSEIHFPKLKELVVERIYDTNLFNDFIRRHSATLKHVEIKDSANLTLKTVDELMNCAFFKYLEVETDVDDYSIFNPCSLSAESLVLRITHKEALMKFIFPDDKLEWDSFIAGFDIVA